MAEGKTLVQSCDKAEECRKLQSPISNDFYFYFKLQERGWFRLLVMEPSLDPQYRISCSLLHRCINENADFEALSYVWGTDKAIVPILVDGAVLHIRSNLYLALRALRLPDRPRILWVDALCINQSDALERNSQVSQMAAIYSGCHQVIVWLGESNEYADRGIDFLGKMCVKAKSIEKRVLKESEDRHQLYKEWLDLYLSMLSLPESNECFKGIFYMFCGDWWKRVWTLQEIALAQTAVVQVGKRCFPWEHLEMLSLLATVCAVHTSKQNQAVYTDISSRIQVSGAQIFVMADTIRIIRMRRQENIEIPLSLMVQYALTRFATDPRDKIFAILGLVNCGPTISPDYNLSCRKVYISALVAMLEYFGDLRAYNFLQINYFHAQEMPSWVPDFKYLTTNNNISSMSFIQGSSPNDPVDSQATNVLYGAASLQQGKIIKSRLSFEENGDILVLKGVSVDKISVVGPPARDRVETLSSIGHSSLGSTIILWKALVSDSDGSYIARGSRKEAFWRTVALDCKVINYHKGLTLQDNPRDRRRRLDKLDDLIPPSNPKSETRLLQALNEQAVVGEGAQCGRGFFTTETGYMGMGPPNVQLGDIVCVLFGGEVPFVLRPSENGMYKMIGQCYLHGVMDGEVIQGVSRGDFYYTYFAID
ncbi:HET-domain-containing protein [Mollisia scopiformis]|uniref:HET-domain-containing protein n=1 Tax=Mollisia scopiformis TaxID=149040 RepID=A0A194XV88_MOLSC|nr:HET-domain-containing protein [Mollisia scopiformis]KUJ23934.1 HET-domain-containing protein [Mollisia scopiformis]